MTDFEVAVVRYLVENPTWGQEEEIRDQSKDEEISLKLTK